MTENIDSYKNKIINLPISFAWRGNGSAIFIEFGKLTKDEKRNHPQGEYSLMLDCEWRIEDSRRIECGSFCDKELIEASISNLLKENVSNIELVGSLPEITISLSSGKKILSFTSDAGDPEGGLFLPDKSWLCSKGGTLVRERA